MSFHRPSLQFFSSERECSVSSGVCESALQRDASDFAPNEHSLRMSCRNGKHERLLRPVHSFHHHHDHIKITRASHHSQR